jgi:hypothetical protein
MSNDNEWEDVVVPQGTFIGWGEIGQQVTGYVLGYDETGGVDYNKQPCPQLVIELTEPCINFRKEGTEKEKIAAGEFVTITCGQANLKRNIRAAALEVGNLVRVIFESTYKADLGTGKSFKVQVNRSARPSVTSDDLV